jgi:transposase-like protein
MTLKIPCPKCRSKLTHLLTWLGAFCWYRCEKCRHEWTEEV